MAGDKAEAGIEPVRVEARLVCGELYQRTAALACLVDHPFHEFLPEPLPAAVRADPDGLDLCSFGAVAAEAGNVRDLQAGHHLGIVLGHDELVSWVGVDVGERSLVGLVHNSNISGLTEDVIGEQGHDRRQVGVHSLTEDHAATLANDAGVVAD